MDITNPIILRLPKILQFPAPPCIQLKLLSLQSTRLVLKPTWELTPKGKLFVYLYSTIGR